MKDFFKKLWKTILENKVISCVVAGVVIVGVSAGIIIGSLSGSGKNPPAVDSGSSEDSSGDEVNEGIVSFETNGGTAIQPIIVEVGTTIDLTKYIPEKENNYFYGWCTDAEFSVRASVQFLVEGDVTLYAQWGTVEKYMLSFETNGGSAIESVYYKPNDYLLQPEDPIRANYSFGGWYKDTACTKQFSFYAAPQMPRKDMTIYAKWNPLNGVIFETNGGVAMEPIYGVAGEPVGELATPERADYIFEGWYADASLKTPYDLVVFPNSVITLYAKWHEQIKDINVTLHFNYGEQINQVTLTGNEGEAINDAEAIATFTSNITELLKDSYLGDDAALASKPIYNFSAWAYDAMGGQRFNGKLPHDNEVDLYAVWSRSAAYCEVTFVNGEAEKSYYVDKNSVIDPTILDAQTEDVKTAYEALGCTVEGFYTVSGNRYKKGEQIAMDMRLIPYVYTDNLSCEYGTVITDLGTEVRGYILKGYNAEGAELNKTKDNLLLLVPEFFDDGVHGQNPVIWIDDTAFKGFNVKDVTLPNNILGIDVNAFAETKLEEINLPSKLYYLGDNAFGSSQLANVVFNSSISTLGMKVFKDTPYETALPTDKDGFIFFDSKREIIYGYTGSATSVKVPTTARNISGGAFKGNTTMRSLVVSDGVRHISNYAFEGCTLLKNVELGKAFGSMGVGIFKDCTSLQSVNFTWKYSLSALGTSMFEGCSALIEINLSDLMNLKVVGDRAFFGCSALSGLTFGDSLASVGVSAFENCASLVYADFGIDGEEKSASKLTLINDRAFANCASLKRVILRGELINNQIVSFKKNVFVGAGYYNKAERFVTPVLYVKNITVDNWRDDEENKLYTYAEIYKMRLPSEYRNMVIKAIDSKAPDVAVSGTVELTSSEALAQFDILAYIQDLGIYTITDDVSYAEDCVVYMIGVINAANQEVSAVNGKYDLCKVGTYTALLMVEDEFGNQAEMRVTINVNA